MTLQEQAEQDAQAVKRAEATLMRLASHSECERTKSPNCAFLEELQDARAVLSLHGRLEAAERFRISLAAILAFDAAAPVTYELLLARAEDSVCVAEEKIRADLTGAFRA